jgi:hypothetical protein
MKSESLPFSRHHTQSDGHSALVGRVAHVGAAAATAAAVQAASLMCLLTGCICGASEAVFEYGTLCDGGCEQVQAAAAAAAAAAAVLPACCVHVKVAFQKSHRSAWRELVATDR